jgi:cytochrome c553
MRIDGGPTTSDAQAFVQDLQKAFFATQNDAAKKKRFIAAVLSRGNYRTEDEVNADLQVFYLRVGLNNLINDGAPNERSHYGYARLDAFGRIFNRVLEHVLNEDELRDELKDTLTAAQLNTAMSGLDKILSNQNRDHIVEHLATLLTPDQQMALALKLFNPANAPVSYPFLWDTPQHDFVQWNGITANSGPGPLGRNTGEVIGVFGTMDWAEEKGWTLASALGGQGFFSKTHINFDSSINLHNLSLLESQVSMLHSPKWPEEILPPLDQKRLAPGKALFDQRCAACHEEIMRDDPTRHVIAYFSQLSVIGTDPTMATNVVERKGWSGILTGQYQNIGPGSIYMKGRVPAFALVSNATANVLLATSDPDKLIFQQWADTFYDTRLIVQNPIKTSMKIGDYVPDIITNPRTSLMAYKARSLNGIWATAPYLHNGSVPTLYDLLLPASKMAGDPAGTKYRPVRFLTGSREFDPFYVGLKSDILLESKGYNGFVFDTTKSGNSNAGHEYGTRDIILPDGTVLKALTEEERLDLLEYLKSQ